MSGITPIEGQQLIAQMLYARVLTDRDAGLELGLFTNSSVGLTTKLTDITEPSTGGYARINLSDASWVVSGGAAGYAAQSFIAAGAPFEPVYGYFIATKSADGTPRLLHLEEDPNGPHTILDGAFYSITPNADPEGE